MSLKAVIFDMDGVLLDSEPLHLDASWIMLQKYGVHIDRMHVTQGSLGASYEAMWRTFAKKYGINKDIRDLVNEQHEITYDYFKTLEFNENEGLTDLIKEIKADGIICAVASASPIKVVELIINKLGLSDYIDDYCAAEMVSRQKPAPEIYLVATKRLNLKPMECVAVEDSPIGVKAAKAAGLKCIAYNSAGIPEDMLDQADWIVNRFNQINRTSIESLFGKVRC